MSDQTKKVLCRQHGKSYATFVCQHLGAGGDDKGFFCSDDPNDPYPDAWCAACDQKLIDGGGEWNDESEAFARVTVRCVGCYLFTKERNQRVKNLFLPPRSSESH